MEKKPSPEIPSLEELRHMSHEQLCSVFKDTHKFNICDLEEAMVPGNFDILCDNSKTASEMASETKKSERDIGKLRYILIYLKYTKSKVVNIPYGEHYEKILNAVESEPKNYTDIENITGIERRLLFTEVNDLKAAGKLRSFRLFSNPRRSHTYKSFDLFGDIVDKIYFYVPKKEHDVAYFILEHTPVEKFVGNHGMYLSALSYLSGCLPNGIFGRVQALYKDAHRILNEVGKQNQSQ
ncbi:MAG: hypothetical protein V1839_03220 [archaeon]